MSINESSRKYVLLGLIAFIIIGLIVSSFLGKKQDEVFETENFLYQQALQLYEAGEYTNAQNIISDLLVKKSDSEIINYLGGLIAASNQEYSSAAILMQKALDINPHLVEAPMFMIQFGEILFHAERFDDARIVLERCREWDWVPEEYPNYQEQVREMLMQIENM